MKTVREVALELELEDVKRELWLLKNNNDYTDISSPSVFPDITLVSHELIQRASMKVASLAPRDSYIIAKAMEKTGRWFEYSYLIPREATCNYKDNLSVLGRMHEDFIKSLARIMTES